MGSSSSKKQSSNQASNGSSSSYRNSTTIREDFQEINRQRQLKSANDIKREAFINIVLSSSSSVKPGGSAGLRKPQNDAIGSGSSRSLYPSLNEKTSFSSCRISPINNFTYCDTPEYNVKSNANTSHSVVPRNQLNSNSSRLQHETKGVNMKTETSYYSSQTSQLHNSSFSNLPESNVKSNTNKFNSNIPTNHKPDNLSNIRTSDTKYSPRALNNLSDPLKNNLNTTEKVGQSKIVKNNVEIMLKHETFLKRLVANYDVNSSRRNRGFYCSVCNFYKIYYGKLSNRSDFVKHDQTDVHKDAIGDKKDIKRYYCRQCKAHFFGDVLFWMDHLNMDLHKFFADKNNSRQISNDENIESFSGSNKKNIRVSHADKPLNTIPSMSLFDYLSLHKGNDHCSVGSDLILKKNIAENFYKRLISDDKGNYSFYCHACEMWTDNNDVWRNHNGIHEKDLKFKNTLKNCIACRVIIVGDDKLKQFHSNDKEHENLKKLLACEINKGQSLNDNDSSDSDDSEDNTEKNEKKLSALLIKDLPHDINRSEIFNSMKQYGKVDRVFMHYTGPTSAKVIFKFRNIPRNLVNNGVVIFIQGTKVKISLIEQ